MVETNAERFFSMAETYDRMCTVLVPQYDFLQDEVLAIIKASHCKPVTVVDLGAGSGIFIDKILRKLPESRCYWVDYSHDFLRVAQNRLCGYGDRVEFVSCNLEQDWESAVKTRPDIIVSMSAIHHLENDAKQLLYNRCFEFLAEEGWFFNVDEMKTAYHDSYLGSLHRWAEHVDSWGTHVSAENRPYYDRWVKHFDNWKARNIDRVDEPKQRGDDIHQSFIAQLEMLKTAGFSGVDVFLKYHLWCAIGGRRPKTLRA